MVRWVLVRCVAGWCPAVRSEAVHIRCEAVRMSARCANAFEDALHANAFEDALHAVIMMAERGDAARTDLMTAGYVAIARRLCVDDTLSHGPMPMDGHVRTHAHWRACVVGGSARTSTTIRRGRPAGPARRTTCNVAPIYGAAVRDMANHKACADVPEHATARVDRGHAPSDSCVVQAMACLLARR